MGRKYAKPHKWTKEQKDFIHKNYKGTPYKEMRKLVNEKFNLNLTQSQISGFLKRNGLANGRNMTFKKGHQSWNKGMKGLNTGGEKGWFKKGQRPHNKVDLGEEVLTKDGYIRVKVQEHGTFPQRFESKQRLIWSEHNGPIPDDHAIIFADRDRTNFDIDNLILVSRAQLGIMNKHGLIRKNKELTRTGLNIADVILKTGERSRS